ncbi:MAG: hypothetical protein ACP5GO_05030 [Thermoprotei archaeon]
MYNSTYRFGLTLFMFILLFAVIEVLILPFMSMVWLLSFLSLLMSAGMIALISKLIRKEYKKSLSEDQTGNGQQT